MLVPGAAYAGTAEQPEAADACGVAEATDTEDLTGPDAPWVDLCAIWLGATTADKEVTSVTVTMKVAGNLADRTPTGQWSAHLIEGNCRHQVVVTDGGVGGQQRARLTTTCDEKNIECGEPWKTIQAVIEETLGGDTACSEGTTHEVQQQLNLPMSNVAFGTDTVKVTIPAADMTPLLRERLKPGSVISHVRGYSATIVHVKTALGPSNEALVDSDFAHSTGRAFVVGQ